MDRRLECKDSRKVLIGRLAASLTCDQCEMLSINGVPCHEHGCPNQHKTWIPDRGWVRFLQCSECGCDVEEGEHCDCQDVEPEEEDEPDDEDTETDVNEDEEDADTLDATARLARLMHPEGAEALLVAAATAQTRYWSALSALEEALSIKIDGTRDLSALAIEDLTA